MKKAWFRPCESAGPLAVDICHCRDSSRDELSRLGQNGDYFTLAQYRGDLYYFQPSGTPPFILRHNRKEVHQAAVDELEALFLAYFEVLYRGNWYPCVMIGGDRTGPQDVCVVADDPHNLSGLGSWNNSYMWGSGVEMRNKQIEAVRLWLSDPIDPRLLNP